MAKTPVHIFVVENNKLFNNMLEYIFTKDTAYRFIDFNSGEDCIKNLHLEPDIILLDHQLPGINGHQTLLKIRKHSPNTRVLMITDENDKQHHETMKSAGACECLVKSNGVEQIVQKLDHYLLAHEKSIMDDESRTKPSLKNLKYL
jgi:DNA-binding response OmpR family regulator